MTYTQDQINLATRELRNATRDLLNADSNTYDSRVKALWHIISTNSIIFEVLTPYLNKNVELNDIEEESPNGWGKLNLPADKNDRISYGLQVLKRFADRENVALNYAFRFFYNKSINACLRKTNEQLFTPFFRDVFDIFDDLKMTELQSVEKEESVEKHSTTTNIYVGNLTAQAPVAIGQGITQTIAQNGLSEKIVEALLKNNVSSDDINKIRAEIEELSNELIKTKPDSSVIARIFKKITGFGVQLAIPVIANAVNNPEVNSAIAAMLK